MGQYVCAVSAWSVSSQGEMVQAVEYKSSPLTVRWDTKSKPDSERRLTSTFMTVLIDLNEQNPSGISNWDVEAVLLFNLMAAD